MLPVWLTDTVTSDLDRALHYTLLWGGEGVELRTVGGPSDRVPYVNEEKLKRRLLENDVTVASVVPGLFEGSVRDRVTWLNEIALLDETLPFCRRIGCPRVVVSAFAPEANHDAGQAVDALRRAGEAASRKGITLAVLNEADMAYSAGTALAGLLAAVDHPAVRAAWDPVAAVRADENPETGLAALEGRIELVRCYNVRARGSTWEATPLEEGAVDWARHLRLLHDQGFDGPVSLVVQLEPAPKQGLRMMMRLIEMLRAMP